VIRALDHCERHVDHPASERDFSSGNWDKILEEFGPPDARVGGLPVTVGGVVDDTNVPEGRAAEMARPAPSRVRVEVLDHAVSQQAGAPVAFRLSRADGGSGPGWVRVGVDVNAFRDAFGGAFVARLGMRLVPECGLSAVPAEQARLGACAGVAVRSDVDFKNGVVTADIDVNTSLLGVVAAGLSEKDRALIGQEAPDPVATVSETSSGVVVLLTGSGDARGVGVFSKTSLTESGTWSAGGNSGNFSYSYPLVTPPVPGGLAPKLSLGYSSATVDGQTAAEHIQNGPLGEGWSLAGTGFIERTLRPCIINGITLTTTSRFMTQRGSTLAL
jgi:hypothetical protein